MEQCRSGVGPDDAHALDGAVAGLARDGKAHVRRVREERELRHLEDAHPRDRLAAPREVVELGDLWIVLGADDLVAAHASLDRGKPRVLRAPRIGVAVLARDLERAGVDHVVEEDRLTRRARRRDQRLRHLGAERRRGDLAQMQDDLASLRVAEKSSERRHRGREPFGGSSPQHDREQERIGERVHEPAVGQIRWLRREPGGRGAVAASPLAVAHGAVAGVERAPGFEIADRGRRGRRGRKARSDGDPDDAAREDQRDGERVEGTAPSHVIP